MDTVICAVRGSAAPAKPDMITVAAGRAVLAAQQAPGSPLGADLPTIVYDGACPFCRWYVQHLMLPNSDPNAAELLKLDARQHPRLVRQLAGAGIDINRDMVLLDGGCVYSGASALHRLAVLNNCVTVGALDGNHGRSIGLMDGTPGKRQTRSRVFGLYQALFRWQPAARIGYPLLRTARAAYLRLTGQPGICTTADCHQSGDVDATVRPETE